MRLLLPDPMPMLTPTGVTGVDTTDHTMAMDTDTGARGRGQLRLRPRLWLLLMLTLRPTLIPGMDTTDGDTHMVVIMAMPTIPMDTTGAESNQYKYKTKTFQH